MPTSLGGTTFRFNDVAAPLFFASPLQVNLQVPWELAGQPEASLTGVLGGVAGAAQTARLAAFAPGIFTATQTGAGQGAILIAGTGAIAAPSGTFPGARPAQKGEFISIFCTGLGEVTNQPANGTSAPGDPLSITTTTPKVTIGGVPAPVIFSGLAPGFVGLYQVNAQVPENTPTGDDVPLVLAIGGATSNTVTVSVQ